MDTMIRYTGDGERMAWFVPFPMGDGLRVSRSVNGEQEELFRGTGFNVSGQYVLAFVPRDGIIAIWTDENPGQVEAKAANEAVAGMTYGASRTAAQPVAAGADNVEADEEAAQATAARARQLMAQAMDEELARARERLASLAESTVKANAATMERTAARSLGAATLASAVAPERDTLMQPQDQGIGAFVEMPISYIPFNNSLQVFLDGILLTPGIDYEEYGETGKSSSAIMLLRSVKTGQAWTFVNLPTHVSASALLAAQDAEKSMNRAAKAAAGAEATAASMNADAANICECATSASDQAELAAKSAELAWNGAQSAWRAACAVSIHHSRPGISAVHSLSDIAACAHGLFIINPHVTHAPTPFMGIWPVTDLEDATWDGVFFIGEPYPCPCAEPPKCVCPPKPEPPAPTGPTGDADDWEPCGHKHTGLCPCLTSKKA